MRPLSYHMNEKITKMPYQFALQFKLKINDIKIGQLSVSYIDRRNFLSHLITATIAYVA